MDKIEFDSVYEEAQDLLDKVRKINRKQTNSCFSEFDTTFLRLEKFLEKVEERARPKVSIVLRNGVIESVHSSWKGLKVVVVDYDNLPNFENPVCSDNIQANLQKEHNKLPFFIY